ncbi:MAG: YhjD/YihY/BrkB family envelope integrity protein [Kiritimatiellia bacterium]|jgi:membrane protein|nr:YhjD/YihY/BrkB family envelope integrity protein [Kiritimatiellia bacterium]MDP6811114.1 YhjD/YihY/BrkB family envelope integrity protein [Kiritimatiellia bacterium]MDP7024425.1 YhjD/YihY/BrkB family envelope integrity protein [Kiritimatiellia bacterium]
MSGLAKILAEFRDGMRRAWRFVAEDVWDLDVGSLEGARGAGVRVVRVVSLVFRGFKADECPIHAAALTFNTLMAIVPVLALSLALARGLGNEDFAKEKIRSVVSEWTVRFEDARSEGMEPDASQALPESDVGAEDAPGTTLAEGGSLAGEIDHLVEVGFEKVENISFAALGGVGLGVLIWMVVSVLGQIEASFNRVWGVGHGRALWRKFTDYLSVLFILPFLVLLASSIPVVDFATRFLDDSSAEMVRAFAGSGFLKNLMVVLMSTLSFGFMIMFMPNTRVRLWPGLTGGLVSALLFIAWMLLCARLQVGAARYGRIYGSFATVPIVLAWVYVSWEIVLFGAEVAFASQNCTTYRMERSARSASLQSRAQLALVLVLQAARTMHRKEPSPFDVEAFAHEHRVPVRFVNGVVAELSRAGIMGELSDAQGCYVLRHSPTDLSVKDVVDAIMQHGSAPGDLGLDGLDPAVSELLQQLDGGMETTIGHIQIQDLVTTA